MLPLMDLGSVSRYAARVLAAHPELGKELGALEPFRVADMAATLHGSAGESEAAFKRRLRRLRERVFLRVMARDLVAQATLEEVCETMTGLAEQTIGAALQWLGARELVVVGMGKLGGHELNVSSDVDLVLLHPHAEGAQRLEPSARRLVRLLDDTTEDGFVFRVDLRPRPYGNSARSSAASTSWRTTSSPRAANGNATPGSRRAP